MRNLNTNELVAISGAAVTVSGEMKGWKMLHVKVTDNSSYPFVENANFSHFTAMIRFFPDHIETLGGKLLFSGPGIFRLEGFDIGAIEIEGGMLYLIQKDYQ